MPVAGTAARAPFASAKLELEAAAKWARARLEEGKTRIGVVVPDLGKRRAEVVRVFSRVMQPGYNLPASRTARCRSTSRSAARSPPIRWSTPRSRCSQLSQQSRSISHDASASIRSPFIGGAEQRARRSARTLDVRVRRDADATISLAEADRACRAAPLLRQRLEKVFAVREDGRRSRPAEWARHFSAVLDAAGFPGERALDSDEFQTRAKWHEMLGELAQARARCRRMSLFRRRSAPLRQLCADTLFQPEIARRADPDPRRVRVRRACASTACG